MQLRPGTDLRQRCRDVQAYPFVVRKVLRNSSSGSGMLLRDIVFDVNGKVKPARMSAVLNAALGHVAEQTDGFVDFDAVPAEGAPLQVSTQPEMCQTPQSLQHHTYSASPAHLPTSDTSQYGSTVKASNMVGRQCIKSWRVRGLQSLTRV